MKFDPKKTIFLIDGSSFLYRSYYGMRPMHTSKGEQVQAVYSFCRMIKKLITKFNTQHISLVWDSKGKTTRHDMYQEYKATRQAPPSDLFEQKKHIVEFADLIGLHQIAQPRIEADDIMYSIAKEQAEQGCDVVFITSDKDMAQALNEHVHMYDSLKDKFTTVEFFKEERGFGIEKLPFYFSMLGDASDNIPGVRGIGKKGATDLVQQFESLEDMYANLDKIGKARISNALIEQKESAFLSRELFLLQYHASGVAKKDLEFDTANWSKARTLFEQLEFKSFIKEIDESGGAEVIEQKIEHIKKYDFRTVTTEQQLRDLTDLLKEKKAFAVDTEGTHLNVYKSELVGISFCVQEGQSFYVPFGHKTDEQQLPREQALAALKPILEDESIKKYLHHAKYDQLVFHTVGIELRGIEFDSLIAARLVVKDWQRIGLKHLSEFYFQEQMLTFQDVVKENKLTDFSYVPLELSTWYSAMDAHQTFKLKKVLEKGLQEEKSVEPFRTIEMPLLQVLYEMETAGIYLDVTLLEELNKNVTQELARIEHDINIILQPLHEASAGRLIQSEKAINKSVRGEARLSIVEGLVESIRMVKINLNSPKQVAELLFERLKLPPQKKKAKGGYSTDAEVLKTLSALHPVPAMIMRYRELHKLKSTYIDALPTYINPKTQRIHTSFSQTIVATGRLSSSDPNLQNIPASGEGLAIRTAFQPKEGNVFLSADYSQIELRVLAFLSRDTNLVNAFLQGHDIHAETAARLFDTTLKNVTHEQRQIGKRINFSILYGLTPYGLSKDLGIPFKDAQKYIEKYFAQYPGVSKWMDKILEGAKEHGYVTTHWGRKRYVPMIHEKNKTLYEEACRVAINTVAQGTAAEIMKLGMINLRNALRAQNLDAQMLLQIHDELLITVPQEQAQQAEQLVKETLENVVNWPIPLRVTTRTGKDWKEISK